jgi:hypothetical protein
MAGEAEIPAVLRGKGRSKLSLELPSLLAPSQILPSQIFAPAVATATQIWQRASPFDLHRQTRVVVSSRGGVCAHLRRLSAVSVVRHDGGKGKLFRSIVLSDSCW